MDWTRDKIGGGDRAPQLSDLAETVNFKDGKPHTLRAIGPARRVARHWFTVLNKEGKESRFPKLCLSYNSDTGEFDGKCPYCDIDPGTPRIEIHQNFIERKLQEDAPRKPKPPNKAEREIVRHFGEKMFLKSGKDSEAWTPVRLAALSTSPARKIADYTETNKVKTEDGTKVFGPNHPKFGFDVIIKYNKDRSPAEQYSVMKDEKTKLTEEERKYLRWPLDLEKPDTLKAAKAEAERIKKKLAGAEDSDEDDDDDDDKPKKSKGKKKSRQVDVEDEDFDDEDEDDTPKKKKKSKSRDDDDEDDDEDEDDRPKKKSSSKKRRDDDDDDEDDEPKKSKGKKKSKDDDWEDDDEDEDDEPKSKKKKRKVEDDDDEDEDDEDDRPKKKSKPAAKKRRDDDDDEDEDDEEDEKPSKKSKKKSKSRDDDDDDDDPPFKPSKKKKKSKDEDDDDDWDDDDDD